MKVLVDMNLAPVWSDFLRESGHDAEHWWRVGSPDAPDQELMRYARSSRRVVLTHDLDFGAILAATGAQSPSVVQIRATPTIESCGGLVLSALRQFERELEQGAIVTIARATSRATVLPLRPKT